MLDIKLIRKVKSVFSKSPEKDIQEKIDDLAKSSLVYIKDIPLSKNILWVTNFNHEPRRLAHDAMLMLALKMRGANILPVICDQSQSSQCVYSLGNWQHSDSKGFARRRKKICDSCQKRDMGFWKLLGYSPMSLRKKLDQKDKVSLQSKALEIVNHDWEHFKLDNGFDLGLHVRRAVLNGEMKGTITPDWQNKAKQMAYHHIYNVLVLFAGYEKIFSENSIDAVYGNGGYYYHWGVPAFLAQKNRINYFRSYPVGLRVFTWSYHKNEEQLIELSDSWQTWQDKELTRDMITAVDKHLTYRGALNISASKAHEFLKEKTKLEPAKAYTLILTGVIWDANTLHTGNVFENMYDWVIETIEWFSTKPHLQAVVRVHPADRVAEKVTGNKECTLWGEIQKRNIQIPPNVHMIWHDEEAETYELMAGAALGICYSSTTGLEFCCLGKPMIVTGKPHYAFKGFTYEPETKADYFKKIEDSSQLKHNRIKELAYKYWYFYAFHASVDFGLLEPVEPASNWVKRGMSDFDAVMKPILAEDLLPGKNIYLDYICDSIMEDKDITSKDRWPPLCLEYN